MRRIPPQVEKLIFDSYFDCDIENKDLIVNNDLDFEKYNEAVKKIILKYLEKDSQMLVDTSCINITVQEIDIFVRQVLMEISDLLDKIRTQQAMRYHDPYLSDINCHLLIEQLYNDNTRFNPLAKVDEACTIVNNIIYTYYNKSTDWIDKARDEIRRYNNPIVSAIFAWSVL